MLDELRSDRRRRIAAVLERMSPAGRQALLRGLAEFDAIVNETETETAAASA